MDDRAREAGQVDASPDDGDRSPEQIQREIEDTRADLGDTVEALAEKADIKSRAKERAEEIKVSAQQKKDELVSKAKEQGPEGAVAAAPQLSAKARQNRLPLAVGGALIAGFILGKLRSS